MDAQQVVAVEPLRRQAAGEVPCAVCGIATQPPEPDRTDERGNRFHSAYADGRTKLLVQMESETSFKPTPVIMSRCPACLARYDAWTAWGSLPGNARALGVGNTETAAERLGAALTVLGFDTTRPSVTLVRSADLELSAAEDPRVVIRYCDPGRAVRGWVATAPFSFLDDEPRGRLLDLRADALAASMTDQDHLLAVRACPPAREALRKLGYPADAAVDLIENGCLCCGVRSIDTTPVRPQKARHRIADPFRESLTETRDGLVVPTWSPTSLDAKPITGRGSPRPIVGWTCPPCSAPLDEGVPVGPEWLSVLVGPQMGLLPGHEVGRNVKTFAARCLEARRAGQPELQGTRLPFQWLRRRDGSFRQLKVVESPPPREPTVGEQVNAAIRRAQEEWQAEHEAERQALRVDMDALAAEAKAAKAAAAQAAKPKKKPPVRRSGSAAAAGQGSKQAASQGETARQIMARKAAQDAGRRSIFGLRR